MGVTQTAMKHCKQQSGDALTGIHVIKDRPHKVPKFILNLLVSDAHSQRKWADHL